MNKLVDWMTWLLMLVGGVLILGAILMTIGDVVARRAFATGFIGLVDVTQFAVIGFAYLAMPRAFLTGGHVSVELFEDQFGPRLLLFFRVVANVLAVGILGLLGYYGLTQAGRAARYEDVSQNIEIPMTLFWVVILTGVTVSLVVCICQAVEQARSMPASVRLQEFDG